MNNGLVKGVKFKNHRYIGDPMNAVRIFSDKEADELILLDIGASDNNQILSIDTVEKIADECYMPFCIGGGIHNVEQIRLLLNAGAEKVSINTAAISDTEFIRKASELFGSQSIVVSIDLKKDWRGNYKIYTNCGRNKMGTEFWYFLQNIEKYGAGELLINVINRDGAMQGYDIELLKKITSFVNMPVIACGGLGSIDHISTLVSETEVSAAAGGSFFVFQGRKRGILITYPSKLKLLKDNTSTKRGSLK